MWIVLKCKKKEQNFLVKELIEKISNNIKIYIPKIQLRYFSKKKITSQSKPLLGDYLFCYHEKFKYLNIINMTNFLKSLRYILKDFIQSQKEINLLVNRCDYYEDKEGFLLQDFFNYSKI